MTHRMTEQIIRILREAEPGGQNPGLDWVDGFE